MVVRKLFPIISLVLAIILALNSAIFAGAQDSGQILYGSDRQGNLTIETTRKLSPELHHVDDHKALRVIVQTTSTQQQLFTKLKAEGGQLERALPLINGYVADVPGAALRQLASDSDTQYISLDRQTTGLQQRYDNNLLLETTGAKKVVGNSNLKDADDAAV